MGVKENNVYKRCELAISRTSPFARVYRNNVGSGWQGPGFTLKPGQVYKAEGGERVIKHPSFIEFGLVKGSGDGIGYDSVQVTDEWFAKNKGKWIAIFLSLETKANGKASKEQIQWFNEIREAGGIALIVNDPDQISLELPDN